MSLKSDVKAYLLQVLCRFYLDSSHLTAQDNATRRVESARHSSLTQASLKPFKPLWSQNVSGVHFQFQPRDRRSNPVGPGVAIFRPRHLGETTPFRKVPYSTTCGCVCVFLHLQRYLCMSLYHAMWLILCNVM